MCGIVGYIGDKKACPILINGLKKLEYRGYDSAGVSTIENGNLSNIKNKGRVDNLYEIKEINSLQGSIGIAHTRWATHGKPSKENSHPHMDNSSSFSVVHNGIIENYYDLKTFLSDKGYSFKSQTDTEVIPNLIHYYYSQDNSTADKKLLRAVITACKDLHGSFALEIISKYEPDSMIVVRQDSPLIIGKGESENYIASDIPAILSFTNEFYLLDDMEFVVLSRNSAEFYDANLNKIEKEVKTIDWDMTSAEKEGYEDYMLKEIFEQPKSIRETIGSKLKLNDLCSFEELSFTKEFLQNFNKIFIIGCGTANYAGQASKPILEMLCGIPVEVDIASEFRYRNPILNSKTLSIFITQSGETADTIAALKLAKSKGAYTLAISNVMGSSITREADKVAYTHAGPEIAVASTKAYTSQVTLMAVLSVYFAETLESYEKTKLEELKKEILSLPSKVEEILENVAELENFANSVYTKPDVFFLGRGSDYFVALEGSLKLKEISYIHSEAYPSGELKHGPIALIENGVPVINIVTDPFLIQKSISNIQEVISRGAETLIITNQQIEKSNFDYIIKIPETNPVLSPILSVINLQLIAYYIAKQKGLDVDKPRNLAKSVTVE